MNGEREYRTHERRVIVGFQDSAAVALEGTAAPALVRFANGEDDLLVVGDAQPSGIRRLWSGRVARYCARWSTCPVLLVPPPALSRVDGPTLTRELRRLVDAA